MDTDPIAFFVTWTCYGTFLPGDSRGWKNWHKGEQLPIPTLENWCRNHMTQAAVLLDDKQRDIVTNVIRNHCDVRGWKLHAVNCRSNHCHVVVTANGYSGEQVRDQLKAWATRRLREHLSEADSRSTEPHQRWWTRKGSVRHVHDETSLEAAVRYTLVDQDAGGSKGGTD